MTELNFPFCLLGEEEKPSREGLKYARKGRGSNLLTTMSCSARVLPDAHYIAIHLCSSTDAKSDAICGV